jgi:RNase P/RNase MRP subunit POP5
MSLRRRFRRRYIAFETSRGMGRAAVKREITTLTRGIDVPGPKLKLIYYNSPISRGLMRCGHRQVGKIREKIEENGRMKTLGVSGTLRAAKRKFLSPQ